MITTIKPYGRPLTEGWQWDGKVLTPYGHGPNKGWQYDGKLLKPYTGSMTNAWEWDGKILKPYGSNPNEGWLLDGELLKPYGRSPNEGWEWDGKILKPYGRSSNTGWEVEGNAPICVLALACGLLDVPNSGAAASIKGSTNAKRKSKYKKNSSAEELGGRLADYILGLVEELIAKIITLFKRMR